LAHLTLDEFVRRHLADRSGTLSPAAISAALDQAHPERTIRTSIVRTALENLVAKSHVQRTKLGSSVHCTATNTPGTHHTRDSPADAQPETN